MTQFCPRPPTAHTKVGPRTSTEALRWTLSYRISRHPSQRVAPDLWPVPLCKAYPPSSLETRAPLISKRCVSKVVRRTGPATTGPGPPRHMMHSATAAHLVLCCVPNHACKCFENQSKSKTCTSRINSKPGRCSTLKPQQLPALTRPSGDMLNGADC